MKKLFLIAFIAVLSFATSNAQEGLRGGLHIGIPVGDISDYSGLNIGADLSYLFNVGEGLDVGFTTGYTHFTGKETSFSSGDFEITVEAEDFGFVPIAGTARYGFSDQMFGAADLGYAVATNGGEGGFYYQPKLGWSGESLDIYGFYKGVSVEGGSIASAGIGAIFNF